MKNNETGNARNSNETIENEPARSESLNNLLKHIARDSRQPIPYTELYKQRGYSPENLRKSVEVYLKDKLRWAYIDNVEELLAYAGIDKEFLMSEELQSVARDNALLMFNSGNIRLAFSIIETHRLSIDSLGFAEDNKILMGAYGSALVQADFEDFDLLIEKFGQEEVYLASENLERTLRRARISLMRNEKFSSPDKQKAFWTLVERFPVGPEYLYDQDLEQELIPDYAKKDIENGRITLEDWNVLRPQFKELVEKAYAGLLGGHPIDVPNGSKLITGSLEDVKKFQEHFHVTPEIFQAQSVIYAVECMLGWMNSPESEKAALELIELAQIPAELLFSALRNELIANPEKHQTFIDFALRIPLDYEKIESLLELSRTLQSDSDYRILLSRDLEDKQTEFYSQQRARYERSGY